MALLRCRALLGFLTEPLAIALISSAAGAQVPLKEYAARRAALAGRLDSGVVVAFGAGIGLEVHDPAQYYQEVDDRFEAGDVFTVEPGLYVSPDLLESLPDTPKNRAMLAAVRPAVEKYTGMGVRIEDVYALTDSGLQWLSTGAPREIPEIEALMRQREPELAGGRQLRPPTDLRRGPRYHSRSSCPPHSSSLA